MADISNSNLLQSGTGILNIQDACIVLVKTEWNAVIVDALEKGCIETLQKNHIKKIISLTVPGAIEIPFAINSYWNHQKKIAATNNEKPDAFITLGCVIRGDTPHFEYVCKAVTEGVLHLNLTLPVPTIFGVLTVENENQAMERTGGIHGHKGVEAAIAALKMISLLRNYPE